MSESAFRIGGIDGGGQGVDHLAKVALGLARAFLGCFAISDVFVEDRHAAIGAGKSSDVEPAMPGRVVILEIDGHALAGGAQ